MYFVVRKDKGSSNEVDGRYFVNVTLPLQELIKNEVKTINRTYKFLLDTGANISLVPISMLFGEQIIKNLTIERLMRNQEIRLCKTANKDNPVRGWYCKLTEARVASNPFMDFTFIASDQIKEDYGILGCDFIDACKYTHEIGGAWTFSSFSPITYRDNWTYIKGDSRDIQLINVSVDDISEECTSIKLPMTFD